MNAPSPSLLSLVDATLLKEGITPSDIQTLIQEAESCGTAAICIPPAYVREAVTYRNSKTLRIATVANFPTGTETLESASICVAQALKDGADEIDLVFPYTQYLAGKEDEVEHFVGAIRTLIPHDHCFKVILEVCAYKNSPKLLQSACAITLRCGADFLKTSTGMIPYIVTSEDVAILLDALKDHHKTSGHWSGIKISGGVRTYEQAQTYLNQIRSAMGPGWINPDRVRFGSSTLHSIHDKASLSSY